MLKRLLAAAGLLYASSMSVHAGETAIPITPPGGTDLSQAILPPSGLYGALVSLPFNRSEETFSTTGALVKPSVKFTNSPIAAAVLAYVYPFQLFGGHFETSLVLPGERLCSHIIAINYNACTSGIADIYSDVFYWSRNLGLFGAKPGNNKRLAYGLNFAAGIAMKAPTGYYDRTQPINVGANSWVAIPNFALTYVTGPNMSLGGDSTEVSARVFYGVPFANPDPLGAFAAGYTSGNLINTDWSVTERYGPARFGAAGSYETQVSDDTLGGGIRDQAAIGSTFWRSAQSPSIQLRRVTSSRRNMSKSLRGKTIQMSNGFISRSQRSYFSKQLMRHDTPVLDQVRCLTGTVRLNRLLAAPLLLFSLRCEPGTKRSVAGCPAHVGSIEA